MTDMTKEEIKEMLASLLHENLTIELKTTGYYEVQLDVQVKFDDQLVCWESVSLPGHR